LGDAAIEDVVVNAPGSRSFADSPILFIRKDVVAGIPP